MKRIVLPLLALCLSALLAGSAHADSDAFSFSVIAPPRTAGDEERAMQASIEETDADNLAFVVTLGIKPAGEPCTDKVYLRQKSLLDSARNGLIVSLAASDWARCQPESPRSSGFGRLVRLRELLFADDFTLGASRLPVTRQSLIAKFRNFPENARWEVGNVMFATINLPSNNNNYVVDAGRNSEFEDRLVANRDWLNRVFIFALREKAAGVVLFSDSNPLSPARPGQRDGFAETRRLLGGLAGKFPGKILVVHGAATGTTRSGVISWRGNIGELGVAPGWTKVKVDTRQSRLFAAEARGAREPEGQR